jgi:hypothetical protein
MSLLATAPLSPYHGLYVAYASGRERGGHPASLSEEVSYAVLASAYVLPLSL